MKLFEKAENDIVRRQLTPTLSQHFATSLAFSSFYMIILYLQRARMNVLAELVAEAVSEMLAGFFMGDTVFDFTVRDYKICKS